MKRTSGIEFLTIKVANSIEIVTWLLGAVTLWSEENIDILEFF